MLVLQESAAGLGSSCLNFRSKRLRRCQLLSQEQLQLTDCEAVRLDAGRKSYDEHWVEHLRMKNNPNHRTTGKAASKKNRHGELGTRRPGQLHSRAGLAAQLTEPLANMQEAWGTPALHKAAW